MRCDVDKLQWGLGLMVRAETPEALAPQGFHSSAFENRRQVGEGLAVSSSDVDAVLAKSQSQTGLSLRFAPHLERQFLADTASRRVKLVTRRGAVVMVTFVGMLISDWFMVPDRFQVAMGVRTLAFIPLYLLTLYLFTRLSTSPIRDWLLTCAAVLTSLLNLCVIVPSTSPLVCGYLATLSLMVVCWDSILRPMFAPALAHCALVLVQFGAALVLLPDHGGVLAIPIGVMLLSSMVFSLYGSYTLERAERSAYLLWLHQNMLRARLKTVNERLYQQARLDPLTGIPNRRHFDEALTQIWQAAPARGADRLATEISVILLDVDFFKLYNDHYGHPAGDRCLQAVARAVAQCVRQPEDLIARIGGEEFAVVLRHAAGQRGRDVGERILSSVKALALRHGFRPDGTDIVTISLGLAVGTPADQSAMQALVEEADKALYLAKAQGRGRLVKGGAACPA
jgi:diguanylate cyclase (GGDEF)-like protein